MNDLRVLTLWQPWATLWADPALPKTIETRGQAWPSTIPLPAWVLICAAAKRPDEPMRLGGEFGVDVLRHPGNTFVGCGVELDRGDYYCYRRPNPPGKVERFHLLPLGAVIGAAHVTDCLPMIKFDAVHQYETPFDRGHGECLQVEPDRLTHWWHHDGGFNDRTADLPYGIYTPGRYGYVTDRTVLFPEPIPWRGMQGWQRATPDLIERVTPYLTEGEA